MPTTITGTDGVSQVQTGAVESGDLPTGSVIQVVHDFTDTVVGTSADNTFVSTGLSASITPISANSKILINAALHVGFNGTADDEKQINVGLERNGSLIFGQIGFDDIRMNSIEDFAFRQPYTILDSPNQTSQLTYEFVGSKRLGSGEVRFQYANDQQSRSFITLMEIAG